MHAIRPGEWEAKVYIQASKEQMVELIKPPDGKIKAIDRSAIIAGVLARRMELLVEWEAAH